MANLNLIKNSPTEGLTDGGKVVASNPLIVPALAAGAVSAGIKCAVRADAGYRADGSAVTVSLSGTSANRWAFSADNSAWQDYGDPFVFSNIATPAPTVSTETTGGSLVAGDYSYRVTATTASGETVPCSAKAITVPAGTATNKNVLSWSAVTGATGYKIYGRTADAELLMATVTDLTWTDDGTVTPSGALPTASTVQVADGNRCFYARAQHVSGDGYTDDTSVSIVITADSVVAL